MKKRFLNVVLALCMALPTMSPVSAEDETITAQIRGGYKLGGWVGPNINGKPGCDAGPTYDDARTGDFSLCATFPTVEPSSNDDYMYIRNEKEITLKAGTTYVMGCWAKGREFKAEGSISFGVWSKQDAIYVSNPKKTENGWSLFEFEYTPTQDYKGEVLFKFKRVSFKEGNTTMLIDDAFIYEQGSDVNLVDNPGFEAYAVKPPMVENANESISVSDWRDTIENGSGTGFYRQAVSGPACVYEGNKASFIYRKKSGDIGAYAYCRYDSDEPMPPGTYTVTFYAKGTVSREQNFIGIDDYVKRFSEYTRTYVGDGWFKYENTVTTTKEKTLIDYYLSGWANNEAYYFDGLSVKDSNGKEYCKDGNFENCYVYGECSPENLVAYSASSTNKGEGVIAWFNPKRDDITAINLTVDGDEVEFVSNTDSRGYNEVVLSNLEDKNIYDVVLAITAGGRTYKTQKTLIQNSASKNYNAVGNRPLGDWQFSRNETSGVYCDATLELDSDIKYSGNNSMKISCARSGAASNVYARLEQWVSLDKNKSYQLSAKTRSIGVGRDIKLMVDWETAATFKGKTRWTTKKYTIAANDPEADDGEKYDVCISFLVESKADAAWIDDVSLYEIQDGEPTGQNLIKNGGFEYDDSDTWKVTGHQYNLVFEEDIIDTVDSLEEGEILGSVYIQNYSENNLDLTLVAALYEDGKLIDISFVEREDISILVNPFDDTQIGSSVKVPEMDPEKDYQMKLMLWDSIDGLKPMLDTPYTLN